MTNGNATLKVEKQAAVPVGGTGRICRVTAGSQSRETVDETVQGPNFAAHYKIDVTAVSQRSGRHIGRPGTITG